MKDQRPASTPYDTAEGHSDEALTDRSSIETPRNQQLTNGTLHGTNLKDTPIFGLMSAGTEKEFRSLTHNEVR
jgi:hypothetical protein